MINLSVLIVDNTLTQ